MPYKRKSSASYASRAKRARLTGSMTLGKRRLMARPTLRRMGYKPSLSFIAAKVSNLNRMIETKHFTWRTSPNVSLPHNNVTIVQQQSGGDLNIFRSALGTDDPMGVGGSRIGDSIAVKGVMIRAFLENALQRSKVHYRVMLVRCAKGDAPSRTNLFTNDSDNKMIDQVNNERFTIVAQKIFNIQASNSGQADNVGANGAPLTAPTGTGNWFGGQGSKTFKMWIPGYKFGNNGVVKFENANQTQVKFYDYRIVIVAYDWYGTLQDVNNVGKINELYSKLYFKDA